MYKPYFVHSLCLQFFFLFLSFILLFYSICSHRASQDGTENEPQGKTAIGSQTSEWHWTCKLKGRLNTVNALTLYVMFQILTICAMLQLKQFMQLFMKTSVVPVINI